MASAFGWTLEYIGGLKLMDIERIYEQWSKEPPLHVAALHFMGYKRESAKVVKMEVVRGKKAEALNKASADQLMQFVRSVPRG